MTVTARRPIPPPGDPAWPDDGRKYEWVEGALQEVPTGFEHDAIASLVAFLLFPTAQRYGVLTRSQAGFRMRSGNLRSPDVGFTRFERLPQTGRLPTGFLDGAPDLCIEVISPSETPEEMQRKVEEYLESGAQIVWQLFPTTRQVRVVTQPDTGTLLTPEDTLTGGNVLPGFQVTVSDLFAVPQRPEG